MSQKMPKTSRNYFYHKFHLASGEEEEKAAEENEINMRDKRSNKQATNSISLLMIKLRMMISKTANTSENQRL